MLATHPHPTSKRLAAVVAAQRSYVRHRPEESPLYRIIEQHLDAFFGHLCERDAMLPQFVRDEFEAYLRCGRLEHGFVRVKCETCRHEHLVAFSCKCRGSCPSCAARRMAETAAKLIEQVLPRAPMRQWVVSFPIPLRLVFASRPEVRSRVLAVVTRALERDTLARAGCHRSDGSKTGVVTFIQRFGSALNLNIHLHMLVPDGGWTFRGGRACFHRAPAPQQAQLEALLTRLIRRIMRVLVRVGVLVQDDTQPYLDLQARDALDELGSASVRYRIAIGPLGLAAHHDTACADTGAC